MADLTVASGFTDRRSDDGAYVVARTACFAALRRPDRCRRRMPTPFRCRPRFASGAGRPAAPGDSGADDTGPVRRTRRGRRRRRRRSRTYVRGKHRSASSPRLPGDPRRSSACSRCRLSSAAPTRRSTAAGMRVTASTCARRRIASCSSPTALATSRWAPSAAAAVERTAGVVVAFNGRPAQAIFHADCGGRTSGAADVWGGAVARLPDVACRRRRGRRRAHAVGIPRLGRRRGNRARTATTAPGRRADRVNRGRRAGRRRARAGCASPFVERLDGRWILAGTTASSRRRGAPGPVAHASGPARFAARWFDLHRDGAWLVFSRPRVRPRRRSLPGRRVRPRSPPARPRRTSSASTTRHAARTGAPVETASNSNFELRTSCQLVIA